jgi:hypothetical protein
LLYSGWEGIQGARTGYPARNLGSTTTIDAGDFV